MRITKEESNETGMVEGIKECSYNTTIVNWAMDKEATNSIIHPKRDLASFSLLYINSTHTS